MSHLEQLRNSLCKELGLACHDTLEHLVEEAVASGRLEGDAVVRLTIQIESPATSCEAGFHAVGPIRTGAERGVAAA